MGNVLSNFKTSVSNLKTSFLTRCEKGFLDISTAKIWFESFEGSLEEKPPDKKYIYILSEILFEIFQIWMIINKSLEKKFIKLRPLDDLMERLVQIHREYTLLLQPHLRKYYERQQELYIRAVYPDTRVNRT